MFSLDLVLAVQPKKTPVLLLCGAIIRCLGKVNDLTHMSIIMLAFFIAYRSLHGSRVLGTLNEYCIDKKQIL
jgi:hypothetical protein